MYINQPLTDIETSANYRYVSISMYSIHVAVVSPMGSGNAKNKNEYCSDHAVTETSSTSPGDRSEQHDKHGMLEA